MAGGSYQSLTNPDYFIAVFQTGWFIAVSYTHLDVYKRQDVTNVQNAHMMTIRVAVRAPSCWHFH